MIERIQLCVNKVTALLDVEAANDLLDTVVDCDGSGNFHLNFHA
jgi:hypothetical protein